MELWVNKVGPFPNPQETYPFYSIPFCRPEKLVHSDTEGLGEALLGYDLIKSIVEINFKSAYFLNSPFITYNSFRLAMCIADSSLL